MIGSGILKLLLAMLQKMLEFTNSNKINDSFTNVSAEQTKNISRSLTRSELIKNMVTNLFSCLTTAFYCGFSVSK